MSGLAAQLRDAFARLSPEVPFDLKAMALPTAPGLVPGVSIGLDTDALRHVLVPLPDPVRAVAPDRTSSGIQFAAQVWHDAGQPRRYLDIVCLKVHLADLFCEVAAEMLTAMADDPERPERAASRVLARWRELLGRPVSRPPDVTVAQGLVGELSVLHWLTERAGPSALDRWVGPLGEVHDFRGPAGALEVKTTAGRQGWRFAVHGIEQLAEPSHGPLHLVGFQLEPAEEGASVGGLVDALVGLGVDRVALLDRVARAGFGVEHLADDGHVWRIRERRIYLISGDFPRIVVASFVDGAFPLGVTHLDYAIDLTAWTGPTLDAHSAEALRRSWAAP